MDKAQLKSISLIALFLIVLSLLIYAVSTSLLSPVTGFTDDDSFLDLRVSCVPTIQDGTTSYNVTNATLYITSTNGSGNGWFRNVTLPATIGGAGNGGIGNQTYLFNFTKFINFTAEGTYKWSVECNEQNGTGTEINKAFGANNTLTVTYATASVVNVNPSDNFIDLDSMLVNFTADATPSTKWNITRIELWTNQTTAGTWHANQSDLRVSALSEPMFANFSINNISNSLPDGAYFVWSIAVTQKFNVSHNETVLGRQEINKTSFTANRTFKVERPPTISLYSPADGAWEKGASSTINFTPSSVFTSATAFTCNFFTNETGTWNIKESGLSTTNKTNRTLAYQFQNGLSDIRWGVFCSENVDSRVGNTSVNSTVRVDRTSPVPKIRLFNSTSAVNNSFFKTNRLIINYTLNDSYPNTCDLYVNYTLNFSNAIGAVANNFSFTASDSTYILSIGCNDTAGNYVNESTDYWVTLDTVAPTFNRLINSSISGSSHQRLFRINVSEEVNLTLYYSTTADLTSSASNSTYQALHNLTISNFVQNTIYYWNLSVCDRATNCADTAQLRFTFPYKLLTGWSYYGVYDARINLSKILNETEAEFVYYWNHTAQKWVSAAAGGTSNMGFEMGTAVNERSAGGRHTIAIFESTNSTWDLRNTSSPASYKYNLTTGDNFVKIFNGTIYSFGNFSRTFLNTSYSDGTTGVASYEFGIDLSTTPGNLSKADDTTGEANRIGNYRYNMSDFFFSIYNNTAVTWEPYYSYNSTINNGTLLTPLAIGDYGNLEVMWVFSRYNFTKNETNIIGNWSY